MIERTQIMELAETALNMRKKAYAPYSRFAVGAALLTKGDEVFVGCNIENISFSATNCAERTALFSAVTRGEREFKAIAVAGGTKGKEPVDFCVPCAVCLQVLREFCDPDFEVFVVKSKEEIKRYTLGELLPVMFDSLQTER